MIQPLEIEQDLMDLKATIADLHRIILDMSEGLWAMNQRIDEIFVRDAKHEPEPDADDEAIELSGEDEQRAIDMYKEQLDAERKEKGRQAYARFAEESQRIANQPITKPTGRVRREIPPEPPESPVAPPEPPENPARARIAEVAKIAPETPSKPSIVERLLGKNADEKAKLRKERVAQLEKELAELSQKRETDSARR